MPELLKLPNGHFSFEYDQSEQARMREVLAQIDPDYSITPHLTWATYCVSGARLTADSDPLGLCLIACDDAGDVILAEAYRLLCLANPD